jgi:cellulose synthase/poly-beta-1,6-N-acetylglucosamine synthase-like glycosyltransferase
MLNFLFYFLESLILLLMGFNVLYIALFSFSGFLLKKKIPVTNQELVYNRFLILIPSYKNDQVILETISENVHQHYPKDKFDILVIADSLQEETIRNLLQWPIKVLPVSFLQSTKAKALRNALSIVSVADFDYGIVLDIDNIMDKDFLHKLNIRLQNKEEVIQGQRTAKNLNSDFAILDGVSEQINNQIFRKGHAALNLSSSLSGSAMAIRMDVFKAAMENINSTVEDKELEYFFVRNNMKVLYEHNAIVYDEKVDNPKVFLSQRKRWVASHYMNFSSIIVDGMKNVFSSGNLDFLDKVLQRFLLPRVLVIGFLFLLSFLYFVPLFNFGDLFFFLFIICAISYLIAIPYRYINKKLIQAIFKLPFAFLLMIVAYLKIKNSLTLFSHTQHVSTLEKKHSEFEKENKFENNQGVLLALMTD